MTQTPTDAEVKHDRRAQLAAFNEWQKANQHRFDLTDTVQLCAMAVEFHEMLAELKSWHDNITAATGGHATTPEAAREVVRTLRDELDRVKGENARLQAIVDTLPTTADGVPVTPGMEVFTKYDWRERPVANVAVMSFASMAEHGPDAHMFSSEYSTEAAALAPAQEKP